MYFVVKIVNCKSLYYKFFLNKLHSPIKNNAMIAFKYCDVIYKWTLAKRWMCRRSIKRITIIIILQHLKHADQLTIKTFFYNKSVCGIIARTADQLTMSNVCQENKLYHPYGKTSKKKLKLYDFLYFHWMKPLAKS
jgi:hypothetical protein